MVTLLGGVVSLIDWLLGRLGNKPVCLEGQKKSGSPKPLTLVSFVLGFSSVIGVLRLCLLLSLSLTFTMVPPFQGDAVFPLDSFVWCCSLPPHPSFGGVVFLILCVVLRSSLFQWAVLLWVVPRSNLSLFGVVVPLFGGAVLSSLLLEVLVAFSSFFRVLLLFSPVLLGSLLLWVVLSSSSSCGWCCFLLLLFVVRC